MILVILKDLIKEYKRGRFLSFDTVGDFELNSYIEKLRRNSNLLRSTQSFSNDFERFYRNVDAVISKPVIHKVLNY